MVQLGRVDDEGTATVYRPMSVLAVTAAVAGVASSLALTTSMLWVLPLVGVGLAIAGLADVSRPGAEKAGRVLALAGLALSIGFGAQAVASSIVSRRIAEARAVATVNAWLDAIGERRLVDARAMANSDVRGDAAMAPHLGHGAGEDDAAHRDAAFLAVPAVAAIVGCGPAATRNVRCTGPDATSADSWGVTMRLGPCAGGRGVDVALQLVPGVAREGSARVERWTIVKADVVP